ncbi:uncharacterized protein LOC141851293 [Brevipalpus obovatus]|uniref:uncharacterized protein LOC141851293 n=1 Tax=Brevipalpus obovatus TaxID=246614 RepID=UPI003D9E00BE
MPKVSNNRINRSYCIFFCRFGRCNKGNECPFIHDSAKIAVCTRFLRGTCKVTNCPFSHELAPEKMPVCSFFLQGRCHMESCPYRHVKVNPKAEICRNFLNGYCKDGDKCKLRHEYICKDCTMSNGKVKECLKCLKKRKKPVKDPVSKGKKLKTDEIEKSEDLEANGNDPLDFIPLVVSDEDQDEVMLDNGLFADDTFASVRALLPPDYDSDDSWEDLESKPQNVSYNTVKPSFKILPNFILESFKESKKSPEER